MKKISILFFEGTTFPDNHQSYDLIIFEDVSSSSEGLEIQIKNQEIFFEVEDLFFDEMMGEINGWFITVMSKEEVLSSLKTKFETVVTESDMQPQFLGGRRQVTKFGGSEIPLN